MQIAKFLLQQLLSDYISTAPQGTTGVATPLSIVDAGVDSLDLVLPAADLTKHVKDAQSNQKQ